MTLDDLSLDDGFIDFLSINSGILEMRADVMDRDDNPITVLISVNAVQNLTSEQINCHDDGADIDGEPIIINAIISNFENYKNQYKLSIDNIYFEDPEPSYIIFTFLGGDCTISRLPDPKEVPPYKLVYLDRDGQPCESRSPAARLYPQDDDPS